jgi:phospholipase C
MRMRTSMWLLAGSFVITGAACSSGQGEPTETTSANLDTVAAPAAPSTTGRNDSKTRTPIKHVLVIIGENRSFDHVFATYKPKNGQRIDNLLSKKIVNEDGTPGPNFALAVQKSANDPGPGPFQLSPGSQTPYSVLPPVLAGGPKTPLVSSLAAAQTDESAALLPEYVPLLLTGST